MNAQLINKRYRIKGSIGSGGMGLVYLVEDIYKDNMLFAIKTIKQNIMTAGNKTASIETFKNEYEIMTRLKHPNLIRVYDFEEDSDNYYIIMEYLEGILLSEYLKKLNEIDLNEKIDIFIQILRALEYIHSRNIIYRDLKPGNVMIVDKKVKLLDFGLSGSAQHKIGRLRGTLIYISPEAALGDLSYSMDIFSLGILFYEMIHERRFYDQKNLTANTLLNILSSRDEFNAYRDERIKLIKNESLRTIIYQMTSYEKEERFLACSEIISEINGRLGCSYEYETRDTKLSYVLGNAFADREREYHVLTDNISRPERDKMTVFIGPPGAGKTRLFFEFKKYCRLNEIPFFESNCMEAEFRKYYSIGEILIQMMTFSSMGLMERFGRYLKLILPKSRRLAKYEAPDIGDDPKKMKDIIIHNISDFIHEFAKEQGRTTIIYFNDIQWIDSGSELILANLLHRMINQGIKSRNILIYANINEKRLSEDSGLIEILKLKGVKSYRMSPLDFDGVNEYVTNIFGHRFTDISIKRSVKNMRNMVGGSPLLLEALIRSLIEADLIVKDKIYWKLLKPLDKVQVPKDIIDILKEKIQVIFRDDAKRKILKIMSLLRIDVHLGIIKNIVSKISSIDTARILTELESLEILQEIEISGSISYRFSGSLVKEMIREGIANKAELSLFLADTLEECVSDNEDYTEEIAYQFLEGENWGKSIIFYEKCGDNARRQYFNKEALKHYETVLILLKSSKERDIKREIRIKLETGNIYELTGDWNRAEKLYSECISLSEKINDKKLLAGSYLNYGEMMSSKGNFAEALEFYDLSGELYEELDDKTGLVKVMGNMGIVYNDLGDYNKALEVLDKKISLSIKTGAKKSLGTAIGIMGSVYANLGLYSKALECYEKFRSIAEETDDKRAIGIAVANMGIIYYRIGDFSKALECWEIDKKICGETGDKRGLGITIGNIGLVYRALGRNSEALKCYESYRNLAEEMGDKTGVGSTSNNMGNLYRLQGEYEKALECYKIKKKMAEETGEKRGIGIAIGNMAVLYHCQGEFDKAIENFKIQGKIFEEIGYKWGLAVSIAGIGEVYFSMGDYESALECQDKAIELFEDLELKDDDYLATILKKSKSLYFQNNIRECRELARKAFKIAAETGNTYQRINALIQEHIIESVNDKESSSRSLLDLLQNETELKDDQIADIYYELYMIKGSEEFREKALKLYNLLYGETPTWYLENQIKRLNENQH